MIRFFDKQCKRNEKKNTEMGFRYKMYLKDCCFDMRSLASELSAFSLHHVMKIKYVQIIGSTLDILIKFSYLEIIKSKLHRLLSNFGQFQSVDEF